MPARRIRVAPVQNDSRGVPASPTPAPGSRTSHRTLGPQQREDSGQHFLREPRPEHTWKQRQRAGLSCFEPNPSARELLQQVPISTPLHKQGHGVDLVQATRYSRAEDLAAGDTVKNEALSAVEAGFSA